jgi:hypothetical protein
MAVIEMVVEESGIVAEIVVGIKQESQDENREERGVLSTSEDRKEAPDHHLLTDEIEPVT